MKLGHFVTTSAVVLAGWLGFTFVLEVPSQRYPKHEKHTQTAPDLPQTAETAPGPEAEVFHVSVSP